MKEEIVSEREGNFRLYIDDWLKEAISKYNTENKMMFLKAVVATLKSFS